MADETNKMTLPDPQYGIQHLLKPQTNYKTLYEASVADITNALYFFEDPDHILDDQAGQDGYSPELVKGMDVPEGARCLFWLPSFTYLQTATVQVGYAWSIIWRTRNLQKFRLERGPWHLPIVEGVTDTSLTPDAARALVPAAYDACVYVQPEPVSATTPDSLRAVQRIRAQDVKASYTPALGGPRIRVVGGVVTRGVIQQGVLDPATSGVGVAGASAPSYLVYDTIAKGDEMILALYRTAPPTNWGFSANAVFPGNADATLARFFDAGRTTGILVQVGTP